METFVITHREAFVCYCAPTSQSRITALPERTTQPENAAKRRPRLYYGVITVVITTALGSSWREFLRPDHAVLFHHHRVDPFGEIFDIRQQLDAERTREGGIMVSDGIEPELGESIGA